MTAPHSPHDQQHQPGEGKVTTLAAAIASPRATLYLGEAAAILGITPETASQGARDGSLPSIRIGRRVLIPRIKLLAMLGVTVDVAA